MTPTPVAIVEVGPRDGLQNERAFVPTGVKLRFIRKLAEAGLRRIEATSFVRPDAIPQLADAEDVARGLPAVPGVVFSALTPNRTGLRRALDAGIRRIAIFTAASETFARRNLRMTIRESLEVFGEVVREALTAGATARGYVSTCFVCPYEGEIPTERVYETASRTLDLGVDEIAVSDTIGAAAPNDVERVVGRLLRSIPAERLALHFHDTYGTAAANVCAGLRLGVRTFDASAGGLGGCPFAPGAAGNLATEDAVYLLERMGFATGVNTDKVAEASAVIAEALGRELPGRFHQRRRATSPRTPGDSSAT